MAPPSSPKGADEEERPPYWIATEGADLFFASLIVLNAIILGVDIEIALRSGGDSGPVLFWIQFGFVVIFVIELILRVRAYGCEFFNVRRNPWGVFDLLIVGTSLAEYLASFLSEGESPLGAVSVMRIFRLMRIARVARLLGICPELSLLVGGLAASIQAVFWVFCLLVVIIYICALICAMELGRTDDEELRGFFGSVGSSFWTHFMVVTLEGYPSVVAAAGRESWLWYLYFVGFILFSNVVLMNLVTGIVCENIVTRAQDDELQACMYREESRKFEEVMLELMEVQGFSADSELGFEDFERLVRVPEIREALNTLEICLDIEDRTVWDILDEDDIGWLKVRDFIASLLRLRGSKDTLHALIVQADILRGGRTVRAAFEEAEAGASNYASSVCGALQNKLLHRLSQLQHGPACQGQDTPRSHGRRPRHGRQRARRGCQPTLQAEAVHGAAPPAAEEPGAGAEAPAAASRPSRAGAEAPAAASGAEAPAATRAGAEAPAAASRPSRGEEPPARAEAPVAASRPSRGNEEAPPTAEAPPAASRPSRISQDDLDTVGIAGTGASPAAEGKAAAAPSGSSAPRAAAAAAAPAAASGSRSGEAADGNLQPGATEEAPVPDPSPPPASAEDRVRGVLEELESSSTEARQTLSRLGEDLAASRSRVKALEAELARREASRHAALAEQPREAEPSWSSQCSPRGLRELQGQHISARELHLLPGVEPRRGLAAASPRPGAAGAGAAGASRTGAGAARAAAPVRGTARAAAPVGAASAARQAAAGGELERALHAWRRQADKATAAPSTSSAGAGASSTAKAEAETPAAAPSASNAGAGAASAAEAAPQAADAATATPPQQQKTAKPRSECMAHRRRLEATYTSLTSPKPVTVPVVGRRRGGAPRQRFLNTFHGHPPEVQSIAKAATYESSDEEMGGGQSGARATA